MDILKFHWTQDSFTVFIGIELEIKVFLLFLSHFVEYLRSFLAELLDCLIQLQEHLSSWFSWEILEAVAIALQILCYFLYLKDSNLWFHS